MIYVASKVRHAHIWKTYRDMGYPINSTWIDESGPGESDLPNLWHQCIKQAKSADVLVAYVEPGDVLKGAYIEIGAALAVGTTIIAVGFDPSISFLRHRSVIVVHVLDDAMRIAKEFVR